MLLNTDPAEILGRIRSGDRMMLARAITLVESTNPERMRKAEMLLGPTGSE